MKHSLPISHLQLPSAERQLAAEPCPPPRSTHHVSRNTQHATRNTPHSGVALVITLVLLSIITFMAVTFLVVSRSQHGSVVTETDMANARLAAESARDRGIADLLAPIQAGTNEFNYGLRVSVNYINPDGFTNTVNGPLNVNYDHTVGGGPIPSALEWERNIANLLYDPRPPVFITNRLFANSYEFRFYLDLNRNGAFDPSGLLVLTNNANQPILYPNGAPVTSSLVGDPQWIGVLRHPEFAHSADNPFVARYAYYAVPAGQTLDINCIHNQALNPAKTRLNPQGPDFLRNQGVGTYEINLAAFLYDLNTNVYAWGGLYSYDPIGGFPARGNAFADAGALLAYRYAMNPLNSTFTLASVSQLFGNAGVNAFRNDFIDGYSGGQAMVGTRWPQPGLPDGDSSRVTTPWAGADNANHFYSTQDLFDKSKTALGLLPNQISFTDRLLAVGTNNSTYDRNTFYRLLSQLGTDSPPEPGGKMNLNYCNLDPNGYVVPNMATNFTPWTNAAQFFTNAAIRLLADAGYAVGPSNSTWSLLVLGSRNVNGVSIPITNLHIPIWPINYYTPSVHRLLQLAANMYDATTNRVDLTKYPYLPTVFRPLIRQIAQSPVNQYVIVGYREVLDATLAEPSAPLPVDLPFPSIPFLGKPFDTDARERMVYGIPLVIGAKKGLPNFNKLAMSTLVQVTRKLQFHRPGLSTTAPVNEIDQMFVVGISNVLGVEAWNSYSVPYQRNIQLVTWPDISVLVTNLETGKQLIPGVPPGWHPPASTSTVLANQWLGYNQTFPQNSFQIPLLTSLWFLSNMTYQAAADRFVPLTGAFERNIGTTNFHVPHWKLKLKPRLRFALVDTGVNRIVDYVNLAADTDLDITDALMTGGGCGTTYTPDGQNGSMWCTNRMYGSTADTVATMGIQNQIEASLGHTTVDWNSSTHEFPAGMDKDAAIAFFKGQFIPGYLQSSNTFSTPFQPFRNLFLVTSWQANDPLVHYTIGDLTDLVHTNLVVDQFSSTSPDPTARLGQLNTRYEPWDGNPSGGSSSPEKLEMTVKDPLMFQSDNWDFPTNKLPNVGWLGRVHRGTPWQTVYLKSFGVKNYPNWFKNWQAWSGNGQVVTNVGQLSTNLVRFNAFANDAYFSQPTNDWRLLDLFTTALNDNATRGQLSVNQTNLAAWSAVLSGVLVLTNTPDGLSSTNLQVQPAGLYDAFDPITWPPVVRLVNALNRTRYNNNPRHVFSRLSDILATPELTTASPFLNTNNLPSHKNNGLNDAAFERLPQQIAGLLKADPVPRFVIYSFGQTLKPESTRAIVKSGTFAGLCTNYQIVAESATRTVVRFEGVQPYLGPVPPAITNLHPVIESFNVLPPD